MTSNEMDFISLLVIIADAPSTGIGCVSVWQRFRGISPMAN